MTFRAARLAVVLTAAAATLLIAGPAQAQTTVNIIANDDNQFVRIDPPGSAPQAPNVLVAPGSVVRFSYLSGASLHNVRFTAKQPATCQITTGPSARPGAVRRGQPSSAALA